MSKTAYWYCPNCHEEVDSSRVTWQELHDACGHPVEWIEGISIDRLREICDAERDGRLVVLPCKVGTRVWVIGQNCDLCRDMYAEEPCLFGSCEYKEVFESVFGYGMIDNFGKTIFLTRAEAEAALKEVDRERD